MPLLAGMEEDFYSDINTLVSPPQMARSGEGAAKNILIDNDWGFAPEDAGDWADVAGRLDGFSGRQIMKLANAWQQAAYATSDNTLTEAIFENEIQEHLAQKEKTSAWADIKLGSTENRML